MKLVRKAACIKDMDLLPVLTQAAYQLLFNISGTHIFTRNEELASKKHVKAMDVTIMKDAALRTQQPKKAFTKKEVPKSPSS